MNVEDSPPVLFFYESCSRTRGISVLVGVVMATLTSPATNMPTFETFTPS